MRMHMAGWILRPFRPRSTVRLRMTLLYGGLFLLSGAALLAISSGLVVRGSSTAVAANPPTAQQPSALTQAQRVIRQLQAQLARQSDVRSNVIHEVLIASLIALGIMVAVS